jgi:hypothetical protein
MGTEGYFSGGNTASHLKLTTYSHQSNDEVKNSWIYTSTGSYVFMVFNVAQTVV